MANLDFLILGGHVLPQRSTPQNKRWNILPKLNEVKNSVRLKITTEKLNFSAKHVIICFTVEHNYFFRLHI